MTLSPNDSLAALLDELETKICRTAYSPLASEVRDFCAVFLDAEGRLASQGRMGIPIFVADLGEPVKSELRIYGRDWFVPRDIMITNEPEVCSHMDISGFVEKETVIPFLAFLQRALPE